jgi:hypothetical protein
MRWLLSVLLCISAATYFNAASAQSPEPASVGEKPSDDTPRLNFMDRRMATCLAIDMQIGIDLAQWAAQNTRDPKVKQYAERMATEGIAFLKLLDERTDGRATQLLRDAAEAEAAADPMAPVTEEKPALPIKRSKLSVLNAEKVLMQMKLEIAEDSADSLVSQLKAKAVGDSSHGYIAGELFRQVQMLSTLKVLRKYTSAGFAPILDDAIKFTDRQLAETMAMLGGAPPSDPLPATTTPAIAEN